MLSDVLMYSQFADSHKNYSLNIENHLAKEVQTKNTRAF
jgi:hypothetical protein